MVALLGLAELQLLDKAMTAEAFQDMLHLIVVEAAEVQEHQVLLDIQVLVMVVMVPTLIHLGLLQLQLVLTAVTTLVAEVAECTVEHLLALEA
jgi:hypothetical protein